MSAPTARTVGQLIAELQKHDPELPVGLREDGFSLDLWPEVYPALYDAETSVYTYPENADRYQQPVRDRFVDIVVIA